MPVSFVFFILVPRKTTLLKNTFLSILGADFGAIGFILTYNDYSQPQIRTLLPLNMLKRSYLSNRVKGRKMKEDRSPKEENISKESDLNRLTALGDEAFYKHHQYSFSRGSRQQQELENNLDVITEGTEGGTKYNLLPEHKSQCHRRAQLECLPFLISNHLIKGTACLPGLYTCHAKKKQKASGHDVFDLSYAPGREQFKKELFILL